MLNKVFRFRFTIIIPLEFHRGQLEACLQRWSHEQTYTRELYEVIAAGCRYSLDQDQLSSVRAILGPRDRLLLYDEPHDIALNAHAADAARGEFFIFTESHCLPEPNALALANEILQSHPEWSGFSGSTIRITHNRLSVVEADMYEADIRYGMEQHPWRKLLDQIFVVRAESYNAAGGFRLELGHFAEWHLAARLHAKGYQIGYAPEVRVKHYYIGDAHELIEFSADFARGEMTYHAAFSDDPCRSYFEAPLEWQSRFPWLIRTAFLAWRVHIRSISMFSRPSQAARLVLWLLKWTGRALVGSWLIALRAFILYELAVWRLRLAMILPVGRGVLRAALARLVGRTVHLERVRFVRRWQQQIGRQADLPAGIVPAASIIWEPDHAAEFRSVGFHEVEEWNGRRFRWSEPVATIEVRLRPGNCRFKMEWLPLRDIEDLTVYLDETPISLVREAAQVSGLLEITTTQPVRLSWTCATWMAPGNQRLLGAPVASITWSSE